MPIRRVLLPSPVHARLAAAVRGAWPCERAALLGGRCCGETVLVTAFELLPRRGDATSFAADAVAFARAEAALRTAGAAFVGFAHSHPHAAPHPSQRDLEVAWPGCVHLLLGGAEAADLSAKAFAIVDRTATPLELELEMEMAFELASARQTPTLAEGPR